MVVTGRPEFSVGDRVRWQPPAKTWEECETCKGGCKLILPESGIAIICPICYGAGGKVVTTPRPPLKQCGFIAHARVSGRTHGETLSLDFQYRIGDDWVNEDDLTLVVLPSDGVDTEEHRDGRE